jgi:hypothetical protein
MNNKGAYPFSGHAALSNNPPMNEASRRWYFFRVVIRWSLGGHLSSSDFCILYSVFCILPSLKLLKQKIIIRKYLYVYLFYFFIEHALELVKVDLFNG